MAKQKKVTTAEDKLRALFDLQIIDSRIDRIRVLRGELPLEVQDAEDQIEGLRTRMDKVQGDVDFVKQSVTAYQNEIVESKALIAKYTEQQNNVRNNREFESLNKEIEYQTLEIELCEKRIRENKAKLDDMEAKVQEVHDVLKLKEEDLESKRAELEAIVAETQAEEDALSTLSDQLAEGIEPRLLASYRRIRGAAKNGLAIVPIEREASAGSYIKIPPQRQIDIAQRKRIIVDEHSGRILVDHELATEERERMESVIDKQLAKVTA
jgi:predicted  nucleic acid-binding Zn-ribbon protein